MGVKASSVGANLPNAHSALDKGGDPHTAEDGADELADGVLVLPYAQGFCQEEWDSDGATETGQIMLEGGIEREGQSSTVITHFPGGKAQ